MIYPSPPPPPPPRLPLFVFVAYFRNRGCSKYIAMLLFSQLGLLLWKNLLLQKNQIIISFFQVAVPILIATCVAYAAFMVKSRSCIYDMIKRTHFQLNISDSRYCLPGVEQGLDKFGYTPKTTLTTRLISRLNKCEYF